MNQRRNTPTRAVTAWVLAVLISAFIHPHPAPAAESANAKAPSFTLPTATGTVSLDSLRDDVVLVDFWASWCGPCKSSFPWMATMQERYGAKGLRIVAINLDKSRKPADEFLGKHAAPFTVAYDPAGKTAKAYGVKGMPTSYLIAPDRAVLATRLGFDTKHAKELEAMIQKACAR